MVVVLANWSPVLCDGRASRSLSTLTRKLPCAFVCRSSSGDGNSLTEQQDDRLSQHLQLLAQSMILPPGYLSQLPNDLRSDLKDAAFALASGPVQRECGEQAGEVLVRLSQAWEKGDTETLASTSQQLQNVLPPDLTSRSAIGKRLIGAGRRFASTGAYAEGELQKIAKALIAAGEALYVSNISQIGEEVVLPTTRLYKFGDLQVELTAQKCYTGCMIALLFGALSWAFTSSLQNSPDSTMQYANDNAVLLATSLRGTLLVLGYSCTILSSVAMVGLLGLALQLSGKNDPADGP